jgi:sugar/nucleoside kinase (ribokinase family)
LISSDLPKALETIRGFGVTEWAVIHCPGGGYDLDQKGDYAESPAVDLPPSAIKGKVGVGDAFCAGTFYAALKSGSLKDALELGNAAAASLTQSGAVEGMMKAEDLMKLRASFAK